MSEFIETVKVVSDNPEHGGYLVKNKCDLKDGDVIYGEKPVAKIATVVAAEATSDEFESMGDAELRAYLTEHGKTPHHLTKEAKLRAMCREVASELV